MKSYKICFSDKAFILSFLSGLVLLILSLVAQFYSSVYATNVSSAYVTDIILSNTKAYDLDGTFIYGTVLLFLVALIVGLSKSNYLPFLMKSVAIFTLIRSVFVSLTHIGPFISRIEINSFIFADHFWETIFTGNDLFFSGHTGIPFLFALIFWHNKKLRFVFLGFSIMFAIVVLLGHIHYSIDVLSAFFITYGIFQICKYLFKKDWELFLKK